MPRVSNNTERKCCVREANVEDGFKVTVYPALMDLEMEINNIICAVKEMHSRFVGDKYIRQRMELCKETLLGNLVLDVANIVERQVDIVKKAKEEMLAELQSKYREMAVLIDKQVKRVFPTADQRHDNFVQRRLEDSVIEYNRKAEEARLRQCEFEKKKIFYRVYQKVSDKFNPGEESVNAADSEANRSTPFDNFPSQPVEVRFKSKHIDSPPIDKMKDNDYRDMHVGKIDVGTVDEIDEEDYMSNDIEGTVPIERIRIMKEKIVFSKKREGKMEAENELIKGQ